MQQFWVDKIHDIDKKTDQVQERLLQVHEYILANRTPEIRVPRIPPLTAKQKVELVLPGTGHLLQYKKYVRCTICMQSSTYRAAHRLFAGPCTGVPAGPGHRVQVYKGLRICTLCGAYSQDGHVRKNLKKECRPKRGGADARALADIRKGWIPEQLPNGYWPDGSSGRRRPGLLAFSAVDRRIAKAKAKANAKVMSTGAGTAASSSGASKRKREE